MEINAKNIKKALNNTMPSMYKITVTYRTVMTQTLPTVASAAIDLQELRTLVLRIFTVVRLCWFYCTILTFTPFQTWLGLMSAYFYIIL